MQQIGNTIIGPNGAALPLSAGMAVPGLVFLSGQLPMRDGRIEGQDIAAQTGIVIDNIEALLAGIGLGLAEVVKATIWLTDAKDFAEFNTVWAARFAAPYPVRSTLVAALVVPGALIEIEVIAQQR